MITTNYQYVALNSSVGLTCAVISSSITENNNNYNKHFNSSECLQLENQT